jgi:glutamyl-tRNA synthetase
LLKLERVVAASGERIKLFSDVLTYGGTFFRSEPAYDAKSVEKRLKKPGAADLLREFRSRLESAEPFDAPTLDKALHDFCAERGLKVGELVHPLRVATTGVEVGIGLFDALAILGREETLRRIDLGLKLAG